MRARVSDIMVAAGNSSMTEVGRRYVASKPVGNVVWAFLGVVEENEVDDVEGVVGGVE